MFEEDIHNEETDLMFRSLLEEGQEPVPAHVWDRVEADLDRISHRRVVALWFRRASVAVAAAAIAAIGIFTDWNPDTDIVSPARTEDMVAVVEDSGKEAKEDATLVAMAEKPLVRKVAEPVKVMNEIPAETYTEEVRSATEEESRTVDAETGTRKETGTDNVNNQKEYFPEVWPVDEPARKKAGVSLVVSGITGTNSAQNNARINPMKRPGVTSAPQKTGVKETSTKSTYGIPVSFGAGVRVDLTPKWSIGAGLNYTLLTRKFYGTFTPVSADGTVGNTTSSDVKNIQHYIGIPVNAYYDIIEQDRIHFYTYAGGTAEKCISDKYHLLNTEITHSEKAKGLQFSANIGMGVEFMLGRHLGLYIDPSIRYYFDCNQPKSIRTAQPLMFGFEMGFRARL